MESLLNDLNEQDKISEINVRFSDSLQRHVSIGLYQLPIRHFGQRTPDLLRLIELIELMELIKSAGISVNNTQIQAGDLGEFLWILQKKKRIVIFHF